VCEHFRKLAAAFCRHIVALDLGKLNTVACSDERERDRPGVSLRKKWDFPVDKTPRRPGILLGGTAYGNVHGTRPKRSRGFAGASPFGGRAGSGGSFCALPGAAPAHDPPAAGPPAVRPRRSLRRSPGRLRGSPQAFRRLPGAAAVPSSLLPVDTARDRAET